MKVELRTSTSVRRCGRRLTSTPCRAHLGGCTAINCRISALLDQAGAQARRTGLLAGAAARPSLGAGRPGVSWWLAPTKIPRPRFGDTYRPQPLIETARVHD